MFDDEEPSQTKDGLKITLFHKMVVQLSLDSSNIQHEKLALKLVDPVIPGFSVPPAGAEEQKAFEEGRKRVLEESKKEFEERMEKKRKKLKTQNLDKGLPSRV